MSGHSWVTRSEYSPGLQVALVGIVGTTPIKMISIIRNRYAHQTVSGDIAKLLVDPVYAASLYGFETQCDALAGGQERWVATGGLLVWCEGSSGRLGGEYVTTFIAAYPASLSPQIYVDTAKARKAKRKK
jgi:hypothetical protein